MRVIYKITSFTVLALLLLGLVSCGGAEARKEKYLEKGKTYLSTGDYVKASVEFKNVLQIDPKHVEAYYYMAQVHEKQGDFQKAYVALNKTLELAPKHQGAMLALAKIYLLAHEADKAEPLAEQVLVMDPGNADALVIRAAVRFNRKQTEDALKDIRDALDREPEHVNGIALLSTIYKAIGQAEKGELLLKSSVEKSPQEARFKLLLIQYYVLEDKIDQAIPLMRQVIDQQPEHLEYYNKLAAYYDKLGDTQAAEGVFREAVAKLPDDIRPKRALIRYLSEHRDLMFAQMETANLIKQQPDNADLKLIAAELYVQSKDVQRAEQIYRDMIEADPMAPSSSLARYGLARLLFDLKHFDESRKVLAELLENNSNDMNGLKMRGMYSLAENDASAAIADFNSVLKQQPDDTETLKLLARAYLAAGQTELAGEHLKRLIQLRADDMDARRMLASLRWQQRRYDEVIEQGRAMLAADENNAMAAGMLAKAYIATGEFALAQQIAERWRKQQPEHVLGYHLAGEVLAAQKKYSAAIDAYKQALQHAPDALEPLSALVRNALLAGKPGIAESYLRGVIDKQADNVVAHNLLGETLMAKKDFADAVKSFQAAIDHNPSLWLPYRNMASAYLQMHQQPMAVESYRKGIAAATRKDLLSFNLAALYEDMGRVDEALALYQSLLNGEHGSPLAAGRMALLLVERRDDASSRDRALSLVENFATSSNPDQLDTLGWVYYKRGELDKALQTLVKAEGLSPGPDLMLQYHLGLVYMDRGDHEQAKKYLETVIDADQPFELREHARQMLDRLNRTASSLSLN